MRRVYSKISKKSIVLAIIAVLAGGILPVYGKVPNDPNYLDQQHTWEQINAPKAWDYTTGSRDVVVATIDAGIDTWHEDLMNNIWTNPFEIPGDGQDTDHNGYINDLHGWNFVEGTNDVRVPVTNGADVPDAVKHGTIIAGLIGAEGDNGIDGVGLNWRVKLMSLRAMDGSGSGSYDTVVEAVNYAVDNGASVINMSFVGDDNDPHLRAALYRAYTKGVVIVAAVGNNHPGTNMAADPKYPACYDQGDSENWIIGVGSVDSNDTLSSFSNYGPCVDITAPGEGIFSTERYAPQYGYNEVFGGPWKGTSFAAPLVAGTAALIKSLHPDWNADQVIAAILQTADPIDGKNPHYEGELGSGRLNAGAAVALAASTFSAATQSVPLYSYTKNSILKNAPNAAAVTEVRLPGTVDAVGTFTLEGANRPQLLAISHNPMYMLHVFKDTGEALLSIPLRHIPPKSTITGVRAYLSDAGDEHWLVGFNLPKSSLTVFREIDSTGNVVRERTLSGLPDRWTAVRGSIYTAQVHRHALTITQMDWSNGQMQKWRLDGVDGLADLQAGPLWDAQSTQVAVVVSQGHTARLYTVDLDTNSWKNEEIGEAKSLATWRMVLLPSDDERLRVLPFRLDGGSFNLADEPKNFWDSYTVARVVGRVP